ncbi:MAG: hypothetical protein Q7K55_03780 [Candidatus Levybacteria bacterium]|nr:hypothetical protein [Candidatus Levybacteria bacterium]
MLSVWTRWKFITKKVVDLQAVVLLSAVYFIFIAPLSFFRMNFIIKNKKKQRSYWIKKLIVDQGMEWAKKQ